MFNDLASFNMYQTLFSDSEIFTESDKLAIKYGNGLKRATMI